MILTVLFLLGSWYLWRLKTPGLARTDVLMGWWVKLVASAIFVWIFTHYYGAGTLSVDPGRFMDESKILASVADRSLIDYFRFLFGIETPEMVNFYLRETWHWSVGDLTLINDSANVIRFNSLLYLISNGDVSVHLLIIAFFSVLGFRDVYLTIYEKSSLSGQLVWWMIILLPSVLFWSSTMMKEPFMMLGFCVTFRAVFGELTRRQRIVRLLIGLPLLFLFKPYVLVCLIPALFVYLLAKVLFRGSWVKAFATFAAIVILAILLFPGKRDQAVNYLTRKQYDFINVGKGGAHVYADSCFFYFRPDQFSDLYAITTKYVQLKHPVVAKQVKAGEAKPFKDVWLKPDGTLWWRVYRSDGCDSFFEITYIDDSFWQLIKNSPEAIVNAAFRPFFNDKGNDLKYFASIETILLFAWLFRQLLYWRRVPKENRSMILTLILFAVLLFLLIGWITPVHGAVVRYRIPAYFALLLVGILISQKRQESDSKGAEKTIE